MSFVPNNFVIYHTPVLSGNRPPHGSIYSGYGYLVYAAPDGTIRKADPRKEQCDALHHFYCDPENDEIVKPDPSDHQQSVFVGALQTIIDIQAGRFNATAQDMQIKKLTAERDIYLAAWKGDSNRIAAQRDALRSVLKRVLDWTDEDEWCHRSEERTGKPCSMPDCEWCEVHAEAMKLIGPAS